MNSTAHGRSRSTDGAVRRLVVAGIVVDPDGLILVARRTRPAALAGCWEFPGGKVEPGESPQQALGRELHEELGIRVQVHAQLESAGPTSGHPGLSDGAWPIDELHELRLWFCSLVAGDPMPGDSHDEIAWLRREELGTLFWAPADEAVAQVLATR